MPAQPVTHFQGEEPKIGTDIRKDRIVPQETVKDLEIVALIVAAIDQIQRATEVV